MKKNNKTDYVAWGLDDPQPGTMEEALVKRTAIFKRITRRLDFMMTFLVVSSVTQVALIVSILVTYF
ncbi:hypothetical protein N9R43_01035 [bacterium]|nr:hypothetical protein [bacterium]